MYQCPGVESGFKPLLCLPWVARSLVQRLVPVRRSQERNMSENTKP
jgi:hypothetical protein